MRRFRLLFLSIAILFIESVVLAFLVPSFNWLFDVQHSFRGVETILVSIFVFMIYKCAVELWIFLIVVGVRIHTGKPNLKDLIIGKVTSGLVMLSVLIMFSIESSHSLDIFVVYVLMYAPSLVIAYFLFKKLWIKGVDWITK